MSERWRILSRGIDLLIIAPDQWAAWDTLRDRPVGDFGLVVSAERNENRNPIPVQTETLMRRWGRDEEADVFHALAVQKGLLDE